VSPSFDEKSWQVSRKPKQQPIGVDDDEEVSNVKTNRQKDKFQKTFIYFREMGDVARIFFTIYEMIGCGSFKQGPSLVFRVGDSTQGDALLDDFVIGPSIPERLSLHRNQSYPIRLQVNLLPVAFVDGCPALAGVCRSPKVWSVHDGKQPRTTTTCKREMGTPIPSAPKRVQTESSFPKAEAMVDQFVNSFPTLKKQEAHFLNRYPVCLDANKSHTVKFIIKNRNNPNAIICNNKGAAHKSNSVYFHLNLTTKHGTFVCSDAECKGKKVFGDMSYSRYFL
jgi:hypothetical protein